MTPPGVVIVCPGGVGAGVAPAPGAGAVWSGSTGGTSSGGEPPRPKFCWEPMKIGFKSSAEIWLLRMMCGVNSITMSVVVMLVSLLEKSC